MDCEDDYVECHWFDDNKDLNEALKNENVNINYPNDKLSVIKIAMGLSYNQNRGSPFIIPPPPSKKPPPPKNDETTYIPPPPSEKPPPPKDDDDIITIPTPPSKKPPPPPFKKSHPLKDDEASNNNNIPQKDKTNSIYQKKVNIGSAPSSSYSKINVQQENSKKQNWNGIVRTHSTIVTTPIANNKPTSPLHSRPTIKDYVNIYNERT